LEESLWLRDQGFKDILMGYPTSDKKSLERLAQNPEGITLMVDLPEHIEFLEQFSPQGKFSVCLDVDLSMDLPGVRFGVFRSALSDRESLQRVLAKIKTSSKVKLIGLMGYEAQIAGVGDKESLLIRTLKKFSIRQLRTRREEIYRGILEAGHSLTLVNGGGTGSLSSTREESCVNELTVGSGFYAPGLFDHYQDFQLRPALSYALSIVRKPNAEVVTCLGGGYVASGGMEWAKLPKPYLPAGMEILKHEAAGEVQTPLKNNSGLPLSLGDLIIMRHGKAGEVCEHFNEMKFVRGEKIEGTVPTYRGEGKCFL
jgi:D-serine deaminase-like pyridoxal phosphate-dependent protein